MAGHSKWANIKHKKAKEDAKKGKIFTKLIREITVSAKLGGDDKDANPRLRAAIYTAFASNMSKDTVERAILKGAGNDDVGIVEELRYEGYGASGVAIIVDCMTDNRNRTAGEVRHAFTKNNSSLGAEGSVGYMFKQKGIISFAENVDEDTIIEIALEAGADDVVSHDDGSIDVITGPTIFSNVQDALIAKGFNAANAEITYDADLKVDITDLETAEKVMKLIDMLEDLDDVQNVYSNVNFSDEVMEKIS